MEVQLEIFKTKKLADDFKKITKKKGMSLRKVSKESNVSFSTLSRVQNNSFPDLINYVRLCAWMGKSIKTYIDVKQVKTTI
jgi:transcriptional regulator with XRE-family HTH domain